MTTAITVLLISALFIGVEQCNAQDLPDAKTVLEQHVKSIGDAAKLKAVKGIESKATMSMPGPTGEDMSAKMTIAQAEGKSIMTIEIEQVGTISQGFDGENIWSSNPFMGAQLMEKEELGGQASELGKPIPALSWFENLDNIKVVALEDVEGKSCYKTEFVDGKSKTTRFFDKESGHIVKIITTGNTPMGEMEVTVLPSNFKNVDGINLPFTQTTVMAQGEMVLEFEEIMINPEFPKGKFDVPDDVKKLIEEKKKSGDK